MNFADGVSVSYFACFFDMLQNITTRADGFTSSPKEVMRLILSPLKVHSPRPGLNPRTLGPVANTITTRPPRTTVKVVYNKIFDNRYKTPTT
jgi:hypothetical protein